MRTLRPLTALAMVAVISAGCGGTGSSGGTDTASPYAKAVKFAKSPQHRHLLRALAHKGGLRARILTEGIISVDDPIAAPIPALAATPPL
jgi:hypothetical protein